MLDFLFEQTILILSEINDVVKIIVAIVVSFYLLELTGFFRRLVGGSMPDISAMSNPKAQEKIFQGMDKMFGQLFKPLGGNPSEMFATLMQPAESSNSRSATTSKSKILDSSSEDDDISDLASALSSNWTDKDVTEQETNQLAEAFPLPDSIANLVTSAD